MKINSKVQHSVAEAVVAPDNQLWCKVFRQQYNLKTKRWGKKQRVPPPSEQPYDQVFPQLQQQQQQQRLELPLGGELILYPRWLYASEKSEEENNTTIQGYVDEISKYPHWRQHFVQGNDEPRAHGVLHDKATNNFEERQPGYRYGNVTLKARPLDKIPCLHHLSEAAKASCGDVEEWKVGVNPVIYRDGKDYIGLHSDDDQGETVIFTAVLQTTSEGRALRIQPKRKKGKTTFAHGAIRYELWPRTGDAYKMDGVMQKHYHHGVLKARKTKDSKLHDPVQKRVVVVFRDGVYKEYDKDSGKPLPSLAPRPDPIVPEIGSCVPGLREGDVYSRKELKHMGAHVAAQKGVSGNKRRGVEAIIVSGRRVDNTGEDLDQFSELTYAVENKGGGGAMLVNMEKNLPIRVFRSSHPNNKFPAPKRGKGSTLYRYDGIYQILSVEYLPDGSSNRVRETSSDLSPATLGRLYYFRLQRAPAHGSIQSYCNRISTQEAFEKVLSKATHLPVTGKRCLSEVDATAEELAQRGGPQDLVQKRRLLNAGANL